MEFDIVKVSFIVISFVFIIAIGLIITTNIEDSTVESYSSTQFILSESTATLTSIGEGITSSLFTSKNQTWLEFDGDDDYTTTLYNQDFNNTYNSFCVELKSNITDNQNAIGGRSIASTGKRVFNIFRSSTNRYKFKV